MYTYILYNCYILPVLLGVVSQQYTPLDARMCVYCIYAPYIVCIYVRMYVYTPCCQFCWVNGCILYKLYVCSAYIRIYTVLPAMLGGSFSVIQQYIGCLNGCMQCLLHLCLLYVLSAHLLCGLCMHYISSAVYYCHLPLPPPPRPASLGSVIKWVSSETSQQARGSLGSTTVAPSPSASGGHTSFRTGWICWRMWGLIVTCSKDGYGAGREDCVWMCACREPVQIVWQLCGVWWSDVRCTYVYDTVLWSMSIIWHSISHIYIMNSQCRSFTMVTQLMCTVAHTMGVSWECCVCILSSGKMHIVSMYVHWLYMLVMNEFPCQLSSMWCNVLVPMALC